MRRNFKQLIVFYKLHALLKAERCRRNKPERVVTAGGSGVGELFLFAHVAGDVFVFGTFAHYNALININAGADEKSAPVLCVKQTVACAGACFVNDY